MTNPAEKIRQVVEDYEGLYLSIPIPTEVGGDTPMDMHVPVGVALGKLLDAIIEETRSKADNVSRDRPHAAGHIQIGMQNAYMDIAFMLKEARTSITNSTHE